jgi:phytanoyl-CoA hydroxylase
MPVDQYVFYNQNGYLLVKNLVAPEDIRRLHDWADDILYGREQVEGLDPAPEGATLEQLLSRFTRIHQLHRVNATAEWGLLHPRILDVLEALIGPDVLALQSMLFFNPPGRGGQGWHQDAYYITTFPDTLIGAWIPLESVDEENGCLWVVPGSGNEPIYPAHNPSAHIHASETFDDLAEVENVSHLDDKVNTLSRIVSRYPPAVSLPMEPGDALFFNGRFFHRSHPNRSESRFRRAYVCHYCNARSWVPWNHGAPYPGDCANEFHILARGWSHLPFAEPKYGTPVDLARPDPDAAPGRMLGYPGGDMEPETGLSAHGETPVG